MKPHTLISIMFVFCFSGCNGDGNISQLQLAPDNRIEQINIPFYEHGYNNFSTQVIESVGDLDAFQQQVNMQEGWNNNRAEFLLELNKNSAKLTQYNILLFRLTAPSGSITFTPQPPVLDNEGNLVIDIHHDVPEGGTADMAYYALAYLVNKSVSQVNFLIGERKEIIANDKKLAFFPLNCASYYDGCNWCSHSEPPGGIRCTERFCSIDNYGEAKCERWE